MKMWSLAAGAVALALSATGVAQAEQATAWRLFVADHAEARVTVLDMADGGVIGRFDLSSPASLYATASRQAVYAVQGNGNVVSAIRTGLTFGDHGDHGDIAVAAPELLSATIAGDRPVHFVEHDGRIALFFDGEGVARIVKESDWLAGTPATVDFAAAAPHHGVAATVGDDLLITVPNAEKPDALPIGIEVRKPDGSVWGEVKACPDLHGEAASGDTLAIACATGLLLVRNGAEGPDVTHLPYAADLPEGKTTTLLGGVGMQYFLGNYGADRVVIIEPGAEKAFRLVDLPARRVHFAIDPVRVKYAYVFTEDGVLNEIDVVGGAITRSLKVTEPYSMDGEWSLPRPRIAVAGGHIAVSDPLKSVVHLIDAEGFTLARDLPVEGMPYGLVAVGGSGENHAH